MKLDSLAGCCCCGIASYPAFPCLVPSLSMPRTQLLLWNSLVPSLSVPQNLMHGKAGYKASCGRGYDNVWGELG